MKLWLKVSLLAIIALSFSMSICSVLMLIHAGKSNLDLAIQNTLSNHRVRTASWMNAMENEMDGDYSPVEERSLAKYLIGKFSDRGTVLTSGDDYIFSGSEVDPRAYLLSPEIAQQYIIEEIGGKSYIIVGTDVPVTESHYQFYVIEDITSVYRGIEEMALRFSVINSIVILISAALIIAMVRLVLRPIAKLQNNTSLIARGIYDKRIEVIEKDEIGELGADFNRMADAVESRIHELEEEAQRRTLFMSALTHELKTPITSISGNAQTLLMTKMTEEERTDALIRINDECLRIERLSGKLMQLLVLRQSDDFLLKKENVEELFKTVSESCRGSLKKHGVTLHITNRMEHLLMEKDLLAELLMNLVDNACKASKPGDAIELTAKDRTISVEDHGSGIAEDELGKITQPFYMVDKSRSRKAGGIGLGLALCEEIALLHGASLEFFSEPGVGTTVKVVF
jgi:two-component system phosphate regulon sensor histidine kinase PhoR